MGINGKVEMVIKLKRSQQKIQAISQRHCTFTFVSLLMSDTGMNIVSYSLQISINMEILIEDTKKIHKSYGGPLKWR